MIGYAGIISASKSAYAQASEDRAKAAAAAQRVQATGPSFISQVLRGIPGITIGAALAGPVGAVAGAWNEYRDLWTQMVDQGVPQAQAQEQARALVRADIAKSKSTGRGLLVAGAALGAVFLLTRK